MATQIVNAVIGTAGHIDHGKSSLVRALTGIDPDRLPEEKEKGITIDLGFAPLNLANGMRVGIIDVPGHERFVKNMVAGASGIDFVLMVIAADDGIMAQTREHLQIVRLLGVRDGLTVITKQDLVDADYLELLKEDIKDLIAGSVLEGKPLVAVSSKTGDGIEALKKLLEMRLPNLARGRTSGPFRMPIQRVFAKEGFGTVVTGVPLSGSVKVGDGLDVLPPGYHGRVKGLHAYGQTISGGNAGHSTAVNLHGPGIDKQQVERGMVAVTPGIFEATGFVTGSFELLSSSPWPLKHRAAVRFHAGTTEIQAKALILNGDAMKQGAKGFIQIQLEDKTVVAPGDYFILRCQTPMVTLGGGRVLDNRNVKRKRMLAANLVDLDARAKALGNDERFIAQILRGEHPGEAAPKALSELCAETGLLPERVKEVCAALIKSREAFALKADAVWISEPRSKKLSEEVGILLGAYLKEHPGLGAMPKPELKQRLSHELAGHFDDLLALLEQRGVLRVESNNVLPPGRERRLEGDAAAQAQALEEALLKGGLTPPGKAELETQAKLPAKTAKEIIKFLRETGKYVDASPDLAFHRIAIDEAKKKLRELFASGPDRTTSEIRQHLGISRKYAVPLVELLDKEKFTTRDGDTRRLV